MTAMARMPSEKLFLKSVFFSFFLPSAFTVHCWVVSKYRLMNFQVLDACLRSCRRALLLKVKRLVVPTGKKQGPFFCIFLLGILSSRCVDCSPCSKETAEVISSSHLLSTSTNPDDPHVFHLNCLLFLTLVFILCC